MNTDNKMPTLYYTFSLKTAFLVGTNAAVIFHGISLWIQKNAAENSNYIDGKFWTCHSIQSFQNTFPWLTYKQIRDSIDKLKEKGLIETGRHSSDKMNQTRWFTLTPLGLKYAYDIESCKFIDYSSQSELKDTKPIQRRK